jgi:hypothetical protein
MRERGIVCSEYSKLFTVLFHALQSIDGDSAHLLLPAAIHGID